MTDRIDYGTLLEYDHTGALAADALATSGVVKFGADEGFQIESVWVYPPFDAGGDLENLTVQLVIDGESIDIIHLHSSNHPPYLINSKWIGIPLGQRKSNDPILNTCLKGKSQLQVKIFGGLGGITGDVKIKLIGDYFKDDSAVRRLLGSIFNPVPSTFYDVQRNKAVTVSRPVASTIKNLSEMSGGAIKAPVPRVLPYISFAWNKLATTPNQAYNFTLAEGHVDKDWEELMWDYDETEALLITNIAVSEVANSEGLWVEIADLEYPRNHFDIGQFTNELPWSHFDAEQPPREYKILIHNEKGMVKIKDNGTLIGANTVLVGLWGKKFEL